MPFPTNPYKERLVLHSLLAEAAATCQARAVPAEVLLIVDGLDEDAYFR